MLENVDADGDNRISYDEWVCYIGEAEHSGEYSIEELKLELNWYLKGRGASCIERLDKIT